MILAEKKALKDRYVPNKTKQRENVNTDFAKLKQKIKE